MNPVPVMALVEGISRIADETMPRLTRRWSWRKKLGKTPVA